MTELFKSFLFTFFSFRQSLRTDLMVHQSNTTGRKPTLMSAEQRRLLALNTENTTLDMSEVMFNKIGACFNQLQKPKTNIGNPAASADACLKTPGVFVEEIFKICRKLLEKDLHQILDKLAEENSGNPSYIYKSYSEALNFTATSLLREMLHSCESKFNYYTVD